MRWERVDYIVSKASIKPRVSTPWTSDEVGSPRAARQALRRKLFRGTPYTSRPSDASRRTPKLAFSLHLDEQSWALSWNLTPNSQKKGKGSGAPLRDPAAPPGLTSPRAPRSPRRPPAPGQQLHHQEQAQRAPPRPPRRHRPPADGCLSGERRAGRDGARGPPPNSARSRGATSRWLLSS